MGNYQTLQLMYGGQSTMVLELRALAISAIVLLATLAVLGMLAFAIRPAHEPVPAARPESTLTSRNRRPRASAPSPDDEAPALPRMLGAAELEPLLLGRVRRLAALAAAPRDAETPEARMARRALLSTVRDCEAAGLGDAARALLVSQGAPDPNPAA